MIAAGMRDDPDAIRGSTWWGCETPVTFHHHPSDDWEGSGYPDMDAEELCRLNRFVRVGATRSAGLPPKQGRVEFKNTEKMVRDLRSYAALRQAEEARRLRDERKAQLERHREWKAKRDAEIAVSRAERAKVWAKRGQKQLVRKMMRYGWERADESTIERVVMVRGDPNGGATITLTLPFSGVDAVELEDRYAWVFSKPRARRIKI